MIQRRSIVCCLMCVGLSTTVLHLSAQAQPQLDDPLRHTLEFEGVEREYFVRLPVNYVAEKTFWLAIVVHGGNGNGRDFYLAKDVRLSADELGLDAIVVSPSFSNEDFQASRFPALGEGKFLHRVLDDLHEQYQLRPKILLTGYSRGGQFSHRFAFSNPELVEAVAPFAAGTWTTPNGSLLIESFGKVGNPGTFLSKPENRLLVTERLYDIFSVRVANVAGQTPKSGAKNVPFLVMCGSLDTRFEIAQEFAQSMELSGYSVETEWPRTPHGSRNKEEFKTEFEKYSKNAVEFFLRVTEEE